VSNVPEVSESAARERNLPVVHYRIHTRANEIGEVSNVEDVWSKHWLEVVQRAYVLARRLSYQVNGRNWEVWGFIEYWNPKKAEWFNIMQYKSRLQEGAKPI
jgi:hypothetical protein